MAEVSIPSAEVLLSKRVQELVLSGEDPPESYVSRKENDESDEADLTANSPIPVVDIGRLCDGESEELEKLKLALSTWGCFQAIGHGIPSSFLDEVLQVGREFFEQPMEEKKKYEKGVSEFEGYGADPVPEEGQSLDWSDRIFLMLTPEDTRNYRFWPQNPPPFKYVIPNLETILLNACWHNAFKTLILLWISCPVGNLSKKTLEEYSDKTKLATETISKAMARSLNLDENCFLKQFGERSQLGGRFNYYSPCMWPERILGLKCHADGSGYTIILQDEPGLQIQHQGKWFPVPKNPNALLVIMGDQMEIMSNGVFKSAVHRVVSDTKRDRISIAMFYAPEVGKEIGPEEGLINKETPRLFKTVKDYADIHWGYYQRGMRALHTAQV